MAQKAIGDGSAVIDVGDLGADERDQQIEALRVENRQLRRAVSDAELKAERAREDADRALSNLRRQLSPLYRALQMVFGELDAAGVTESAPAAAAPSSSDASAPSDKWEAWKQRLGPGCAKVIDTLLLGNEMTITAISVAARMGKRQVYEATSKMGQAGITVKNGGKFSLKQL